MKELLKIFFALFFICLMTFSTINVFAEDSDISNQTNSTNSTNSTNTTKTVTKNAVVQPMSTSVSVTVTPSSINLGTLMADGLENTYTGAAAVRVRAYSLFGSGTLTVRAAGDFTKGTDISKTIALSNFKYNCSGYVDKTPFTTTDTEIDTYFSWILGSYDNTYTMNYYITIPTGTDPGIYNTTIYYMAT